MGGRSTSNEHHTTFNEPRYVYPHIMVALPVLEASSDRILALDVRFVREAETQQEIVSQNEGHARKHPFESTFGQCR